MNKFNNVIKKIDFFYKLAADPPTTTTPATTQDQSQVVGDMVKTNANIDFIKKTISALLQTYYPQMQQNASLIPTVTSLSNYYAGIELTQKRLQSGEINYAELYKYMTQVTPEVAKLIYSCYVIEEKRNAPAAAQLYQSTNYLQTNLLPFFSQLLDSTQKAETSNQAEDAEVSKLKSFLENFKPEQITELNKMKIDSGFASHKKIFNINPEEANSLPQKLKNLYKAYTLLSDDNKKKFNVALKEAKDSYKNAPLTGVDGELKNTSNVREFQKLLNNFAKEKNLYRNNYFPILSIDGNIGKQTTNAINSVKFNLNLPYNASALQVYQSLQSLKSQ